MGVEKHLKITGTSDSSWKDAIVTAVSETSRTIDHINEIQILNQKARIVNKKIVEYIVDLDLSFTIDRNRN